MDNNGKIYGDSYTVEDGLTIPSDKILTIENGKTLIIPDGVTFDFDGEIRLDEGDVYKRQVFGQGFDSPRLHQISTVILIQCVSRLRFLFFACFTGFLHFIMLTEQET